MRGLLLALATLLPLATAGCDRWQARGIPDDTAAFGFPRALEYAERASAAYESDDVIRERFGAGRELRIRDIPGLDVKAFVEIDEARRVQWVVVRGTASLANVKVDVACHKDSEARLGCPVHRGFYNAAEGV